MTTNSIVVSMCYSIAAGCAVSAVAFILVASHLGDLHGMDDVLFVGGVKGLAVVGLAFLIAGLFFDFADV